jgi:predicted GTPase
MSRWRVAVVIVLLGAPFAILAGIGSWDLMQSGWWMLAWVGLIISMGLGYGLAWYWQRQRVLLRPPEFDTPLRWTERDHEAWKLVEARAREGAKLAPEKLSEIPFYLSTSQEMAQQLASFYNPGATDPVGALTIPEILAVVELASADLSELIDHHLPGGHLLSINDWKRARQAVSWYQTASQAYWIGAALFDPVTTGLRWLASRIGVTTPLQALQNHLYLWFYTAFVHRVGTYLIDLNSGRLRVGARRYRELTRALERKEIQAEAEKARIAPGAGTSLAEDPDAAANRAIDQVGLLTVTLVGQVKAGKSSVANALLGEQRARTDVLPATNGVDRYELKIPDVPTKLVLFDTVGYAHTGPRQDQLAVTRDAVRQSDLVLLVLHARNPGRQADLALLEDLRTWFSAHPDLRRPPIVAVLTHIDLLSPAMEWDPPYQVDPPIGAKAVNIRDALGTVHDQLGDFLSGAVPLCAAPGRVYGVDEWLLPAVANRLDEIRGVALLRCLKAEASKDSIRKVFRQLMATGKQAALITWDGLTKELGIGQGKKG